MTKPWSRAKLDTFFLDIQDIDDGFDKSLAIYEYPFTAGAGLDDMGMNARTIRFKAFWWAERYDEHKDFVAHVSENAVNELQHPAYGLIKGRVQRVSVRHDDRRQTVECDIEFVEQKHGDELSEISTSVLSDTQAAFTEGQKGLMATFKAAVKAALGAAEGATVLTATLTEGQSALSQLTGGLSRVARTYVGMVDDAVSAFDGLMNTVENPAESIISTVDYGASLPGRVVGAVARCIERYSDAIAAVEISPAQFSANFVAAMSDLTRVNQDFAAIVAGAAALHGTLALGRQYQVDEDSRREAQAEESSAAFDVSGRPLPGRDYTAPVPIDELDRSLATMREQVQAALEYDRTNTSLKDAALALTRHVNHIKLDRERIITVTVQGPLPLHAVCHHYGLPWRAAERIVALNPTVENPTFVDGEVQLYVR